MCSVALSTLSAICIMYVVMTFPFFRYKYNGAVVTATVMLHVLVVQECACHLVSFTDAPPHLK